MITKKSWVIRADTSVGGGGNHPMHEGFVTREKAREFKRLLKGLGNWKNVKMYRATTVETANGFFNIYLEPAR